MMLFRALRAGRMRVGVWVVGRGWGRGVRGVVGVRGVADGLAVDFLGLVLGLEVL